MICAIPRNMVEPQKILAGEATCKDIVKCMYRLSDFELAIYKRIAKQGPMKPDDLAPVLKKDRSTIYRALQKLVAAGLAFREILSRVLCSRSEPIEGPVAQVRR
jgi:predicted transcriptional regulator